MFRQSVDVYHGGVYSSYLFRLTKCMIVYKNPSIHVDCEYLFVKIMNLVGVYFKIYKNG